jgi:hypothetical protein
MAMNSLAGSSLLLDRVEKVLTVSQLPQGVVLICGAQPTMPTPERGCCAIIAAAYAIPEPAVAASTPTHPRPLQTDALGFVIPAGVEPETLNHFDSFPSDHGAVFAWAAIVDFARVYACWPLSQTAVPHRRSGTEPPIVVLSDGVPAHVSGCDLARRRSPDRPRTVLRGVAA